MTIDINATPGNENRDIPYLMIFIAFKFKK